MNISKQQPKEYVQEVQLNDLLRMIWQSKITIAVVTSVFIVVATIYAFSLPNIYKVEAVIAPTSESNELNTSSLLGGYGGLASLAGINVGGGQGQKTMIALEVLNSTSFIHSFIKKHQLINEVLYPKEWNSATGLQLDENRINDLSKLNEDELFYEAVEEFKKELLRIHQIPDNSFISISVLHQSPFVAQKILNLLVSDVNEYMRERDINDAQKSLAYLEDQLINTRFQNVQEIFFNLMEKQTETIMLANIREQYIFEVISPAYIPQKKYEPFRSLIMITGALIGFIFGTLLILLKYSIARSRI